MKTKSQTRCKKKDVPRQPGSAISLMDVARAAGVSHGTVSQVLNNTKTSITISEPTRQRVLLAVRQMGYVPNTIARSLRTNRTSTIGVVCNSPEHNWHLLCEIESLAQRKGFDVLVALSRWQVSSEEEAMRRLLNRRVDGLIVTSPAVEPGSRELMESLVARKFPIIGIGPMPAKGVDHVDYDRKAVYEQLAGHLIECGCRKLLLLTGAVTPGVRARIDGIKAGISECREASLALSKNPDGSMPATPEDLDRVALECARNCGPQALICLSDLVASKAIRTSKQIGIDVPRDMAVTGGGNSEWGAMMSPPLTTTRRDDALVVAKTMERLFERIENPSREFPPYAEFVPMELIVRRSSLFGCE